MMLKPNETTQFTAKLIASSTDQSIEVAWISEESLRLLLEAAPLAIVTINQAGRTSFVNAKLEQMFGYHREELIGQEIEMLLPERFQSTHLAHRAEYMAQPRVRPMGSGLDLTARHKDGTEFPIEVGLSFIKAGDELLIMGSIIDISLRKQAEELLEQRVKERTRELERRRNVAVGLRDILAALNSNRSLDEILDYIVALAVRLLEAKASAVYRLQDNGRLTIRTSQGLPSEYLEADLLLGQSTTAQAVLTRQPVATPDLAAILLEGNPETGARRQALLDGGFYAVLAVPLLVKDEVYGGLTLYYPESREFSVEEIELAVTFADQVALAIENARLRAQVEQTAVAAERSRLARDLHDAVTQTLFSASLIAEVLPRLWDRNPEEGHRRLNELRELTRGALAEMRTLLLELRPSRLTETKLSDLLHQLAEAVSGRARIPIALQIEGECNLSPDMQISLYRTAQEALNNIAKHSRASQATVHLRCHPTRLELSISDDGRGFTLDSVEPDSLGLSIMRERAEVIGANLMIESQMGQGTQIALIWEDRNNQTKD